MKRQLPGMILFRSDLAASSKAVSCHKCRQRKRKCSREHPSCGYCKKHGDVCEYGPKTTSVTAGTGPQDLSFPTAYSTRDTETINQILPLEGKSLPLNVSDGSLSDSKASVHIDFSSESSFGHGSDFHSPKEYETRQYFAKSSWTNPPNQIDTIHPNLRTGPVFTNVFNCSLTETLAQVPNLSLLMSYLPEKKECDELFDRYRTSVHPIIPVIDLEAIGPVYEMLWDNNPVDLVFYIRLFTILYAGSVAAFEHSSFKDNSKDSEYLVARMKHLVGATEIALAMNKFPSEVSIVGLQSSVVLHYVLRNDCKTDDCGSISNIIRLSQLMELNRDPLKYHGIKDTNEVQYRRILWWLIFYLDCVTSLSSKISPIINPNECDTQFPNEYYHSQTGFQFYPIFGFANGRFRWAELTNWILRLNYNLNTLKESIMKESEELIENFSLYCSSLIQKILHPENVIPSKESFTSFISSYISTLPDRCYILLLFSTSKEKRTDLSSVSKEDISIRNQKLIQLQIHFLEEYMKYGSMPDKAIYLWEIRKFQPIQSLLSLLRSVVVDFKQVCTPENATTYNDILLSNDKIIDCISRAINELSYLSRHTSPLCVERWDLLRELKQSVWEQLFVKFGNNDCSLQGNPIDEDLELGNSELMDIFNEMLKSEALIDECIYTKVWDRASGHYLE